MTTAQQSNTELAAQLSSTRKPGGADPMELRSLSARASNAERRLTIAQNQLASAEERLAAQNAKTAAADGKWDARVREYEERLKAAEEKYKRERQGAKESAVAYETQVKSVPAHALERDESLTRSAGPSTARRSSRTSGTRSCRTCSNRARGPTRLRDEGCARCFRLLSVARSLDVLYARNSNGSRI
jgi:multidrug resistance efflux pump